MAFRIRLHERKIYVDETDADIQYTEYMGILVDKSQGISREFPSFTAATNASDTVAQEKNKVSTQAIAFCRDFFPEVGAIPNSCPVRIGLDAPL